MKPEHVFTVGLLLLLSFLITGGVWADNNQNQNNSFGPKRIFVFGDSYADTGNQRKSLASSWKTPYGITFPGKPAGRFSDGRVFTDYIAKFYGIRSPIPYRWRGFAGKKVGKGMNMAYGGTGVFNTQFPGPNMTVQIDLFQSVIRLRKSVFSNINLQSSMALVTLSGNDYSAYLLKGGLFKDIPAFITQVVKQLTINLKRLHSMGLKKVVVTSLQPLGCLPSVTILNSFQQCNDTQNSAVNFHNLLLRQAIEDLNILSNNTSAFFLIDLYTAFNTVLENKGVEGDVRFESPLKPCCMGVDQTHYSCGSLNEKGEKMYTVCNDPESSFFWDTVHPTEAGWRAVYLTLKSSLQQIY
ncbi:GDSL esterase/lipase At5g03610-like [Impatiens glandulifera]|uniref:GDSL esterase/lipase At5g03610-like n=1 Tax=Impatiens glandulifera TaxID=253017 RepID=UPI001FB0F548|nr:GDSL esterase/lipase At5g03610-like [Impatiens glandulifera]